MVFQNLHLAVELKGFVVSLPVSSSRRRKLVLLPDVPSSVVLLAYGSGLPSSSRRVSGEAVLLTFDVSIQFSLEFQHTFFKAFVQCCCVLLRRSLCLVDFYLQILLELILGLQDHFRNRLELCFQYINFFSI